MRMRRGGGGGGGQGGRRGAAWKEASTDGLISHTAKRATGQRLMWTPGPSEQLLTCPSSSARSAATAQNDSLAMSSCPSVPHGRRRCAPESS